MTPDVMRMVLKGKYYVAVEDETHMLQPIEYFATLAEAMAYAKEESERQHRTHFVVKVLDVI